MGKRSRHIQDRRRQRASAERDQWIESLASASAHEVRRILEHRGWVEARTPQLMPPPSGDLAAATDRLRDAAEAFDALVQWQTPVWQAALVAERLTWEQQLVVVSTALPYVVADVPANIKALAQRTLDLVPGEGFPRGREDLDTSDEARGERSTLSLSASVHRAVVQAGKALATTAALHQPDARRQLLVAAGGLAERAPELVSDSPEVGLLSSVDDRPAESPDSVEPEVPFDAGVFSSALARRAARNTLGLARLAREIDTAFDVGVHKGDSYDLEHAMKARGDFALRARTTFEDWQATQGTSRPVTRSQALASLLPLAVTSPDGAIVRMVEEVSPGLIGRVLAQPVGHDRDLHMSMSVAVELARAVRADRREQWIAMAAHATADMVKTILRLDDSAHRGRPDELSVDEATTASADAEARLADLRGQHVSTWQIVAGETPEARAHRVNDLDWQTRTTILATSLAHVLAPTWEGPPEGSLEALEAVAPQAAASVRARVSRGKSLPAAIGQCVRVEATRWAGEADCVPGWALPLVPRSAPERQQPEPMQQPSVPSLAAPPAGAAEIENSPRPPSGVGSTPSATEKSSGPTRPQSMPLTARRLPTGPPVVPFSAAGTEQNGRRRRTAAN